ncbi:MAG TPA: indole-3-glycerol phosphate synthase TrpC [Stellaceae bacterium]|nr:indole-3-glycerol phosphate synthase TrpC [Stellaceae bacterium]
MSDVLAQICRDKRIAVAAAMSDRPLASIEAEARSAPPPRGFVAALRRAVAAGGYGLIAEIKRASPSRGLIRADFDPPALAGAYAQGGATCLSVLTDEPYFQGHAQHLVAARGAVTLPVLRKDFILEPYQVVEARAMGADCILLIMTAVDDDSARTLEQMAVDLGMDVLVEVHDRAELDRALMLKTPLIGINNRNLKTLKVDLAVTEELARGMPSNRLLVSESGIHGRGDLARMARVGARCFLVGEALMKQDDVEAATRVLLRREAAARAPA